MQTPLYVHFLENQDPDAFAFLKQALDPGITLSVGALGDHPEAISILVAGYPTGAALKLLPNLKSLIIPWAGIAPEALELMCEYPHVSIHNLHHNALPVAEYALALLLSGANSLIPVDRALRTDDWRPRYTPTPSILVSGKTILILGYGHIGRAFAALLSGFNMTINATRSSIDSPVTEGSVSVFPASHLQTLLPKADFLVVTLPLTKMTKGLIGNKELSLLPPGAVVVNIGRGELIDQAALYRALKERSIFAAGIDVWYNYPQDEESRSRTQPADFSFHELDNIVMSPHRAGGLFQKDKEKLKMAHLAELLNLAARGTPMPNRVDPDKGY